MLDPRSGEIDLCPPRNLDLVTEGDASAVTILMNPRVPTSPELRLAYAVLEDAVHVLTGRSPSRIAAFLETREWVEETSDGWPYSFVVLCQTFELQPEAVRTVLLAKAAGTFAMFQGGRFRTSASENLAAANLRRQIPGYVAPVKPPKVAHGTLIDERACQVCGQRFFVYSGFGQTGRQIYCGVKCRRKWSRSSEARRVAIRVRCRLRREGQLTIGAA